MFLNVDVLWSKYLTAIAFDLIAPLCRGLTLHRDFGMVLTSKFLEYCKSVFGSSCLETRIL